MWKTFLAVKFCCMKNYVKPSVREKLDHVTLLIGTTDVDSDKLPEIIVKSVVDVAHSFKRESIDLSISNLAKCNDKISERSAEVHVSLKELCRKHNMYLINHTNAIKTPHLNRGKLQLNRSGSNILEKQLLRPYPTLSVDHKKSG